MHARHSSRPTSKSAPSPPTRYDGALSALIRTAQKRSAPQSSIVERLLLYSEPGSNRHRFPYRCLRPTRLPIPPSEQIFGATAIDRDSRTLFHRDSFAKVIYFRGMNKLQAQKLALLFEKCPLSIDFKQNTRSFESEIVYSPLQNNVSCHDKPQLLHSACGRRRETPLAREPRTEAEAIHRFLRHRENTSTTHLRAFRGLPSRRTHLCLHLHPLR